jgi:pimeloyl-ACP methyl ester carboxylesterase
VPDASHWIVHERPDLVNDAIERFVSVKRER